MITDADLRRILSHVSEPDRHVDDTIAASRVQREILARLK